VKLYPAVDILAGKAVRLVKGEFDAKTVYDEDPLSAAQRWARAGALYLHVVDLDGAKGGEPANLAQLERIAGLGVPVQYGGGLRSLESIGDALSAGATRVILGTAALRHPDLLERALELHGPERVVVSVDVRGKEVVVEGWTEPADRQIDRVFTDLLSQGVSELIYTSVDRDGMLAGPEVEELVRVAGAAGAARGGGGAGAGGGAARVPAWRLIYSGGVGTLPDLEALARLRSERRLENLAGVIVGKALYEGRFTVDQAQEALAGPPQP
jgi:phosphoribosylformimino-5-aminoimidazole carboxamide ribotide isomerase